MNKLLKYFPLMILPVMLGCKTESAEKHQKLKAIKSVNIDVKEPSGLCYLPKSKSLYLVSDDKPFIYEMDLDGNIIKKIHVEGKDMEGVAVPYKGGEIIAVEEYKYRIIKFSETGKTIDSFRFVTSDDSKHALEGITLDKENNIYLLNEKSPCLLVKLNSSGSEVWRKELGYSADLSDVCYDEKTDCLWALSDESKLLMKLSMDGALLEKWRIPVNQAEGLAMTPDYIYIVSDQDAKLYIFKRP